MIRRPKLLNYNMMLTVLIIFIITLSLVCQYVTNNILPDDDLSLWDGLKIAINDIRNKRCVTLYWKKY